MVPHRAMGHRTQDRADGVDGSAGTATAVDVEREDDSENHAQRSMRATSDFFYYTLPDFRNQWRLTKMGLGSILIFNTNA